MKIYKRALDNKEQSEEWSLFDYDAKSVYERNGKLKNYVVETFRMQDEMALKSDVFKRILQQEIKEDPQERYESTNYPKTKTRNALLTAGAYYRPNPKNPKEKVLDREAWENDLLKNPFYGLSE
ncbi:MAG: hypothetical protein WC119_02465 [Synergistaceae bacterium]